MSDSSEYWNEHRSHKQDVGLGIVRCNSCGDETREALQMGRQYCPTCHKTFKTPKWKLAEGNSEVADD